VVHIFWFSIKLYSIETTFKILDFSHVAVKGIGYIGAGLCNCAGFVRHKSGKKVPYLLLSKRWHLLPPFLSNEPGTASFFLSTLQMKSELHQINAEATSLEQKIPVFGKFQCSARFLLKRNLARF
jgi:hypothetical protein